MELLGGKGRGKVYHGAQVGWAVLPTRPDYLHLTTQLVGNEFCLQGSRWLGHSLPACVQPTGLLPDCLCPLFQVLGSQERAPLSSR